MAPQAALPSGNRELLKHFKVLKFLGKGSFGSVYKVKRISDGKVYAVKEMDVKSMSQTEREEAVNECRLLASAGHPNIVNYNEAFLDGNKLCIVMEYAAEGDFSRIVKKQQTTRQPFDEIQIWNYFIQITRGINALHSMRILHRDIKPGNIMVAEGEVLKIGDLGIAKLLKSNMAKTQIGTPHYMPPEVWKSRPYAFPSDAWALGCMLYEMCTFNVPFEARSMSELRYKILRGRYPPVPRQYSADLQQMITKLLDQNPDSRPTMKAILDSDIVKKMEQKVRMGDNAPVPSRADLLQTIQVPRNLNLLKGKFPEANYAVGDVLAGVKEEPMPMMQKNMPSISEQQQGRAVRPPSANRARPQVPSRQPSARGANPQRGAYQQHPQHRNLPSAAPSAASSALNGGRRPSEMMRQPHLQGAPQYPHYHPHPPHNQPQQPNYHSRVPGHLPAVPGAYGVPNGHPAAARVGSSAYAQPPGARPPSSQYDAQRNKVQPRAQYPGAYPPAPSRVASHLGGKPGLKPQAYGQPAPYPPAYMAAGGREGAYPRSQYPPSQNQYSNYQSRYQPQYLRNYYAQPAVQRHRPAYHQGQRPQWQ